MNQATLSLTIFNLNKDSQHFLTDFEVIRILLGFPDARVGSL